MRALASALVLSWSCAPPPSSIPEDAAKALSSIQPAEVHAHMSFLADDLLEGRDAGTRGYDIAARYVAAEFEAMGLEAAGDNGSFFQMVPLRRATIDDRESSLTIVEGGRPKPLRFGEDFVLSAPFRERQSRVRAPLVFAGYGVSAPELDWDDYSALDVENKVVILLSGAPPRFGSTQRAYYSSRETKAKEAVARGATGILTVMTPTDAARFPWSRLREAARAPAMRWLDPATGEPSGATVPLGALSRETAEDLLSASLSVLEPTEPGGRDLPQVVILRAVGQHEDLVSPNVAARLGGTDLADEIVVYSAHLDHVGFGEEVDGDDLYNGAYDNASGVAVLLAVARAFSHMEPPPKRSLIFLAVTAEEKGLLGSDYFAHHPTVPRNAIVANVNADGALMFHPLRDVVAFGVNHSTLLEPVSRATEWLDIDLSPDFMPEQVIFIRSDQYSFVKQGIPAVYPFVGNDTGEERVDGRALLDDWMATRYHKPSDDMRQEMDFEAGADYAKLAYLIGYNIANADGRPEWNEGDFLAEKFSRR